MKTSTEYATCRHCNSEMHPGGSCASGPGRLTWEPRLETLQEQWDKEPWSCPDCNAAPNAYHHIGCDNDICPECGDQTLCCGAEYTPEKGWHHIPDEYVTKQTRAGKEGKLLECPECLDYTRVFHFSWTAIVCSDCGEAIYKTDWIIAPNQEGDHA